MARSCKHTEPACVEPAEHVIRVKNRHGIAANLEGMRGVLLLFQNVAMRRLADGYHLGDSVKWISGDLRILQEPGGSVAVCAGFGIGAPATAIVVEQLVSLGASRIIAVGTAGTLQPFVRVGDIVLCERAVRGEGVSGHYWQEEKYAYASPGLTELMERGLRAPGRYIHIGSSWTTDALYRETRREADKYGAEGVLTVEMEAAALFAVGRYRDIECAASFVVSDSLVRGQRRPSRPDITAFSLDVVIHAAISALLI
jgi:uridine phosphorylase